MRQDNTIYKFSIKLSFSSKEDLRKIILSKICILYCLVSLNSVLFNLVCFDLLLMKEKTNLKYVHMILLPKE